ncbi:unnamed protein product [Lymnaea stagnalis]|uniref:Nucleoside phosphorylase domain-containing protein n=1 Tax=Lymnaea stagnalis TaxID=6523 RepID=A0AAV2HQ31_LYMST
MCSDRVQLPNPHLDRVTGNEADYLMHLGIHRVDWHVFKDVKFVCVGGTVDRMRKLSQHLAEKLNIQKLDYSFENHRYSGFKVGPIFCVTHGIGTPSLSVMLHEVFKLLYRAGCSDVTLIRIGTCGGVGVRHGTVVVSTGAITPGFEPFYITSSLGEILKLPTDADPILYQDIVNSKSIEDKYDVISGLTFCTEDFYQGQGRFDGSFCDYTQEERAAFLSKLRQMGVVNLEMESAGVLGMARKVGIKAAVVCVVLVDRMEAELPSPDLDIALLQEYPITLVSRYIVKKLSN